MGLRSGSVASVGSTMKRSRPRILITGNLGYVGPLVVRQLRHTRPQAELIGLDPGFFAHCLTSSEALPERLLDRHVFGDVRHPPHGITDDLDAVIWLAAISNDPMGQAFEELTFDINHRAAVQLAEQARLGGARAFVYASSCSVYGAADDGPRSESSPVMPLTAYARSKIAAEQDLAGLAGDGFTVTALRFATACGMSDRLRLDLVLNDFVAGALAGGAITLLSDGSPWRPLIHVADMARAFDWAVDRSPRDGGSFLAVNVGSDEWNYQVRTLAYAVADAIRGVDVQVPSTPPPDRRTYRVSFALFRSLAPAAYQPQVSLDQAITDLRDGLQRLQFDDAAFRQGRLARLPELRRLQEQGLLSTDLEWRPDATPSEGPHPVAAAGARAG
jgi:nucleoside-diphosphate-sugar epimerase